MTKSTNDRAEASPTKQFFVSMLTRDINLADAILDLVDNCLDGALQLAKGENVDYRIHFVKIELRAAHFSIEDNCGGIPREVAKNYAFKMGREPDDERNSETETIGMYGVGMKRAIFKMGREALVRTRYGNDTFEVPITSAWLDAKSWEPLPINEPTEAARRSPSPARSFASGSYTKASQGTSPMKHSRTKCARPSPNISRCSSSGALRLSSTASPWSPCALKCCIETREWSRTVRVSEDD